MSRKLVDSFLAYDMHVMLQRFSHHPHRIDAGSWYLHCQKHAIDEQACVASKTVKQHDRAAGSNNRCEY